MSELLTIRDLRTHFFLDEGTVRAVDGVDLDIPRGYVPQRDRVSRGTLAPDTE